jgi:hypothetical protein
LFVLSNSFRRDDYWIVDLVDDYRYAVVATSDLVLPLEPLSLAGHGAQNNSKTILERLRQQ